MRRDLQRQREKEDKRQRAIRSWLIADGQLRCCLAPVEAGRKRDRKAWPFAYGRPVRVASDTPVPSDDFADLRQIKRPRSSFHSRSHQH